MEYHKDFDDAEARAIQAELDALGGPPVRRGRKAVFTSEQDGALLYARQNHVPWDRLEKWWKKKYGWGCDSTLKRRFDELGGDER